MKTSEKYNDRGLRIALKRKYKDAERMKLSDDFNDRLMQHIERPKHRHLWLYSVVGAVAACILLLLICILQVER